MRFTLTYDGSLPSSGNKARPDAKWKIRKHFHPQLEDLWASHPALRMVDEMRHFPKQGGTYLRGVHHLYRGPLQPLGGVIPDPDRETIDLCAPITKHGADFVPLVRETFALHCGLRVTFLRREAPGKVYQGGDIDGRMKTLLDALAMPQHAEQVISDPDAPSPIYCLLEDDSMISSLQIDTERLLAGDNLPNDYAKLTIEVDVRVRQTTIYNQAFLG